MDITEFFRHIEQTDCQRDHPRWADHGAGANGVVIFSIFTDLVKRKPKIAKVPTKSIKKT